MTDETQLLDPISMARFLVMPGAGRLLEAFGQIPEGPLRDSVISHAEVIAQTYGAAPPKHRAPDPLRALATVSPVALAITAPKTVTGRAPPSLSEDSRDEQIVKLALEGKHPDEISNLVSLNRSGVYKVLKVAKLAGVPIPSNRTGPQRLKRVPPSPNYANNWHTDASALTGQALAQTENAAARRGITAQEYLDRRNTALKMVQAGHRWPAVLAAIGEPDEKVVSAWMSSARRAGIDVPFVGSLPDPAQDAPEAAQDGQKVVPMTKGSRKAVKVPSGVPGGLLFGTQADYGPSALLTMEKTAEKRGLTLQAYLALREDIARKRLAGWRPSQIAKDVGQDLQFCRDIIRAAAARGVKFPDQSSKAA